MHILLFAVLCLVKIVVSQDSKSTPCTTEDNPNIVFTHFDVQRTLTCPQLIAMDYCYCTRESVKNNCCGSCRPHKSMLGSCSCRDTLNPKQRITIEDENKKVIGYISNCNKLITQYASWCKDFGKKGEVCCQSCKSVDLSCVDDVSKVFELGNRKLNCEKWVATDKCYCTQEPTAKHCCASCKGKVLTDCKCRDSVNKFNPADIHHPASGEVIDKMTSCRALLAKYPQSCDDPDVKGDGGSCCKSCQGFDTSCLDLVNDVLPITLKDSDGNVKYKFTSCRQMKGSLPELCKVYGNKGCCKTCKNVDTSCMDTKLTQWRDKNDRILKCPQYIGMYPCNCERADFAKKCCGSCKKVLRTPRLLADCCKDDPDWRKIQQPCKGCRCSELIPKKGKGFTKKVCARNVNGAANHCCHTCRKAGFMAPKP